MKKIDRLLVLVSALSALISICSCSDNYYAKELNGKWATAYVISYSDGEKDSITEYVTFKYMPDSKIDDGTFTEIRYYCTNEIEGEDFNYTLKFNTSISGKYEINLGDLSLKYDVSTLVVNLNDNDVHKRYVSSDQALAALGPALAYAIYGYDPEDDFSTSLKKETYKNLFEYYEEVSSTESGFTDLIIDNGRMSYDIANGRIEYIKDNSTETAE